jgi:thiamine pyrophosphokinase
MNERERLAERCRDAWAVLRTVGADEGARALAQHGRDYEPDTGIGSRDGLAEDMLAVADLLDTGHAA